MSADAEVTWSVQRGFETPLGNTEIAPISRRQLALMRGKVFYASGRRPPFLRPDGSFSDIDDIDDVAYHVIGREGEAPIASLRLLSMSDSGQSRFESLLPPGFFERLLAERKVPRDACCEVSRWVVTKVNRRQKLGVRLVAGGWGLTRWLKLRDAWAWAGTRDGQTDALVKMGAVRVSGLEPHRSKEWDDELQAIHFDLMRPPQEMAPLIKDMARRLGLGEVEFGPGAAAS